ncbi:hypothetical protein TNCV_1689901 [Trichonephila clavipes]|nr:hypothetical protein TNCV_1689901 [Trichonephila clavipes]
MTSSVVPKDQNQCNFTFHIPRGRGTTHSPLAGVLMDLSTPTGFNFCKTPVQRNLNPISGTCPPTPKFVNLTVQKREHISLSLQANIPLGAIVLTQKPLRDMCPPKFNLQST